MVGALKCAHIFYGVTIHFSGMSFWTRINLKPTISNALGNGRWKIQENVGSQDNFINESLILVFLDLLLCVCVRTCARACTWSCSTLCCPVDYSFPGSSVHGILQARILEWVDIVFSKGSSQPRDLTRVSCFASGSSWKVRKPNFHVVLDKFSI